MASAEKPHLNGVSPSHPANAKTFLNHDRNHPFLQSSVKVANHINIEHDTLNKDRVWQGRYRIVTLITGQDLRVKLDGRLSLNLTTVYQGA